MRLSKLLDDTGIRANSLLHLHGKFEISPEGPVFRFSGLCSGWHRFRHRWLPGFLKNVSIEGLIEFCDIMMNGNFTKAAIEKQFDRWAQNRAGDVYISSLSTTLINETFLTILIVSFSSITAKICERVLADQQHSYKKVSHA